MSLTGVCIAGWPRGPYIARQDAATKVARRASASAFVAGRVLRAAHADGVLQPSHAPEKRRQARHTGRRPPPLAGLDRGIAGVVVPRRHVAMDAGLRGDARAVA